MACQLKDDNGNKVQCPCSCYTKSCEKEIVESKKQEELADLDRFYKFQ